MGAGSNLSLAKKPVDHVVEEGRGECTPFSNAGAHLKVCLITPTCPDLRLGGRVVRLDAPQEFRGGISSAAIIRHSESLPKKPSTLQCRLCIWLVHSRPSLKPLWLRLSFTRCLNPDWGGLRLVDETLGI